MKILETFPEDMKCLICRKNENKACLLLPIIGTAIKSTDNSLTYESECVHIECLNLYVDMPQKIIYQVLTEDGIQQT